MSSVPASGGSRIARVGANLHPVRRVTVGGLSADIDEELAPMDWATFQPLQESRFALRLLLVRFPSYDRAEMLRRLTAYEQGRLTAPGPIDRSSMNPGRRLP
jgi:hypothetical protein